MASREDLVAELEALKQDLEASRKSAQGGKSRAATGADTGQSGESGAGQATLDWALSQLDGSDMERLFRKFADELGDLYKDKPMLTVFGAFVLGYVLGRAR